MSKKIDRSKLKEAIVLIDNETLKLRDRIKKTGESSDKIKRKKLYSLKDRVLYILQKQGLLYSTGYYKQVRDEVENRVFINKLIGEKDDTKIYSIRKYRRRGQKNQRELECQGEIGLLDPQTLNSNLGLEEAIKLLKGYILIEGNKYKKSNKNEKFKITETKLVELFRLRVVRRVHINGKLNPIRTKQMKNKLEKALEDNNKYPKEEAILVYKARDPKDKRRIVYNIQDGYRRFLLAGELGIDKVYVNIIDESE